MRLAQVILCDGRVLSENVVRTARTGSAAIVWWIVVDDSCVGGGDGDKSGSGIDGRRGADRSLRRGQRETIVVGGVIGALWLVGSALSVLSPDSNAGAAVLGGAVLATFSRGCRSAHG